MEAIDSLYNLASKLIHSRLACKSVLSIVDDCSEASVSPFTKEGLKYCTIQAHAEHEISLLGCVFEGNDARYSIRDLVGLDAALTDEIEKARKFWRTSSVLKIRHNYVAHRGVEASNPDGRFYKEIVSLAERGRVEQEIEKLTEWVAAVVDRAAKLKGRTEIVTGMDGLYELWIARAKK